MPIIRKNKLKFIKLTNNYLLRFIESMAKGVIMWKKDVKISQEARKVLSRALKPETKYVESLSSLGLEELIQ